MTEQRRDRVETLLELDRFTEARALLAPMLAEQPDEVELHLLAFEIAAGAGDIDGVLAAAEQLLTHGDHDPASLAAVSMLLKAFGFRGLGIAFAREVVRLEPNDPSSHLLLAEATLGVPFFRRESRRAAARALALDPANPDLHTMVGKVDQDSRRRGAASAAYRRALAIDPTDAEARAQLASLTHRHSLARAARAHGAILRSDPTAGQPRWQLGNLALRFTRRLYWYSLASLVIAMVVAVVAHSRGAHLPAILVGSTLLGGAALYSAVLWLRTPLEVRRYLPVHVRGDLFLLFSILVTGLMLTAVVVVTLVPGGVDAARWLFRASLLLNIGYVVFAVRRPRLG